MESAFRAVTQDRCGIAAGSDIGGGADLRLNRLFSLRGEVRDFVGGKGLSRVDGRHHVIALGGIALHF